MGPISPVRRGWRDFFLTFLLQVQPVLSCVDSGMLARA